MSANTFLSQVQILSAGAAKGLMSQVTDRLRSEYGLEVQGEFGAVGLMRDHLLAGAACDLIILSQSLIDLLVKDGYLDDESVRPIGVVRTGIAYRTGDPVPNVDSADALKKTLSEASAIYFPDPKKATAGIHFAGVLESLGLDQDLADRLKPFPNGATAMKALASTDESGAIGCTQITEILYTSGVTLAAALPQEFELATVYTAAMPKKARARQASRQVIDLITGPETAKQRLEGGFEPLE